MREICIFFLPIVVVCCLLRTWSFTISNLNSSLKFSRYFWLFLFFVKNHDFLIVIEIFLEWRRKNYKNLIYRSDSLSSPPQRPIFPTEWKSENAEKEVSSTLNRAQLGLVSKGKMAQRRSRRSFPLSHLTLFNAHLLSQLQLGPNATRFWNSQIFIKCHQKFSESYANFRRKKNANFFLEFFPKFSARHDLLTYFIGLALEPLFNTTSCILPFSRICFYSAISIFVIWKKGYDWALWSRNHVIAVLIFIWYKRAPPPPSLSNAPPDKNNSIFNNFSLLLMKVPILFS